MAHYGDGNVASQEEKIAMAAKFVLQSPPGEINDVLNDIRTIIADDASLEVGLSPAIVDYNVTQFTVVDVPGQNHQAIITESGRLKNEDDAESRFLDPRSKTSFVFDHITLKASDSQPIEIDEKAETFRSALETSIFKYITDHFNDGVASVFSDPSESGQLTIAIVANKYNAPNYWSGRWRSEYKVDLQGGQVTGKVLIDVHYYEQGNVQLQSIHSPVLTLPNPPINGNVQTANKITSLIEAQEGEYQTSLTEAYHELGEKAFKGLRRALPMTRQKLDWDKVLGYKLGAEISASNSGRFGSS